MVKTETWVDEGNLIPLLEMLSILVEYRFDPDDRNAVLVGVRDVNAEANRWFDYPLIGKGRIDVSITMDSGSSNFTVRTQTDLDVAGAVNMACWFCQHYRIRNF